MESKKFLISHSSINDFNNCSRLFYFKKIYRNPKTGNRIQLVNPYLSLGSAVHDTIDEVINLPPSQRKKISLKKRYQKLWKNYSRKRGGFVSKKQETEFKERGEKMILKVEKSDLLTKKSLKKSENLPKIKLFENIVLTGSFDWIEVLKNGNLHIIDFKTGKTKEKKDSWQLPIYKILAQEKYTKKVEKLSYWYLEKNNKLTYKEIIDSNLFISKIKRKALEIERKIKSNDFSCNSIYGKCFWCREYESIFFNKAEYVGHDNKMKKDLFFLDEGKFVLKKIENGNFLNKNEKEILKIRINGDLLKESKKQPKINNEKLKDAVFQIKKKIKNNLTKRELTIFIKELNQNGEKINF